MEKFELSKREWIETGRLAGWIKTAEKIPGTQNVDPDAPDFAVDLGIGTKTLPDGRRRNINKLIGSMSNYFTEIPLDEIVSALRSQDVVMLQEDGTLWGGWVTTQGECGHDKAPMVFELAGKFENKQHALDDVLDNHEYHLLNNSLVMSVCTMPSGKLEVVAYVA